MKESNSLLELSDLPNHVQNLNRVLDVFLDPKEDRFIQFRNSHLIFFARGTGYDGNSQTLAMDQKGRVFRTFTDTLDGREIFHKLPTSNGKILCLLLEMGYRLGQYENLTARKYKFYAATGISTLETAHFN